MTPPGWGFTPSAPMPGEPKAVERDCRRVEDAIVALAASGYALAPGTRQQKLRDIRERFGLSWSVALRCLQAARGEVIHRMHAVYAQGYAFPRTGRRRIKETPRPLQTVRGADSRSQREVRKDGTESIGAPSPAQALHRPDLESVNVARS